MRDVEATGIPGTLNPESEQALRKAGCVVERDGDRTRIVWPRGTILDSFTNEYQLPSGRYFHVRGATVTARGGA
jgi:hypothetical protein